MNRFLRRVPVTLVVLACAIPVPLFAAEEPAEELGLMTIEAAAPVSTTETPAAARERLETIPGGTSLVDEERLREGRAANLEDALDRVPGVFARSRFGQDEVRLSIRGSGVSQTFNSRGVRLLRDGLPVTEADGNTRTQLIDPLTAQHIEVYRGANAMTMGAATLGGAINLVSPTGYTADPFRLRGEIGSFGYRRLQASGGWVGDERLDGMATFTTSRQDGFRDQSKQRAERFYGNLGYQHGEHGQTRIHVEAQDSRLELPGSLTAQEYRDNPRQAAPGYEDVDAARKLKLARISAEHVRQTGSGEVQIGGFIQDLQMNHPLPFAQIDGDQQDVGAALRQVVDHSLAGRDNRFVWGAMGVVGRDRNVQTNRFSGMETRRDYQAATVELYANNDLALTPATNLVVGGQLTWASREVKVRSGPAAVGDRTYTALSPRVGLRHQLTSAVQVFGNISRSVEPPINGQLIGFDDRVLDAQRADTLEAGLRGDHGGFRWEAVAYHARIKDEILIFQDPDNLGDTAADNAGRTRHSGLEVGGEIELPLDRFLRAGDQLQLGATWTYNRFRFDRDEQWGNNRIPGIPEQMLRIDARYKTQGFYIGPVVEVASGYHVDFANTLRADRYMIWGLRAGYESPQGWRLFIDARNLGDRRHVASTSVVADAREDDRVFNPGARRSVYGGVEWRW